MDKIIDGKEGIEWKLVKCDEFYILKFGFMGIEFDDFSISGTYDIYLKREGVVNGELKYKEIPSKLFEKFKELEEEDE